MRPLKNFAVEARAERVLAKEKPTPAPWHPTTQKRIDELIKSNLIIDIYYCFYLVCEPNFFR